MWKEYLSPETLDQALAVLAARQGSARVIAGGTDLVLQAQRGEIALDCAVDITRIAALQEIRSDGDEIVVGSCVTHAQAAASSLLAERAPVLATACSWVGSPQIRNVGTLGGNVVNAQPAADATIALLALDASAEIAGPTGVRREPLARLSTGPGASAIDPSREILVALRFRGLGPGESSAFGRLARRKALALPMLNVAVVASIADGRFRWARIALGPVAPTPYLATRAQEALAGSPVSAESIARAAQIASEDAQPRSSVLRGSREYRKDMVRVYVRRALEQAAGLS